MKHEKDIDYGGAYIKHLPGGKKFDAARFGGDSLYGVIFGPDICGGTKRIHVILHSDTKPEGHDDIDEEITDPDATKPDDWYDEDDSE